MDKIHGLETLGALAVQRVGWAAWLHGCMVACMLEVEGSWLSQSMTQVRPWAFHNRELAAYRHRLLAGDKGASFLWQVIGVGEINGLRARVQLDMSVKLLGNPRYGRCTGISGAHSVNYW
jgi:hypothetical protein